MSMATLGGDARRKSILPDYKMLMRSDDGRFNHILYQAGPWAEWQARAPSQLAAHGIDGTNLWEATQFEADRPRYGKPDRPGGACGMLSTYGTSPQQPRRLRSPNRIFAGENDAEGAHVRGPVSFVPPRESGLAAGRATQGVVATSGAFMSDEPTLGSSSSTPWLADGRLPPLYRAALLQVKDLVDSLKRSHMVNPLKDLQSPEIDYNMFIQSFTVIDTLLDQP